MNSDNGVGFSKGWAESAPVIPGPFKPSTLGAEYAAIGPCTIGCSTGLSGAAAADWSSVAACVYGR